MAKSDASLTLVASTAFAAPDRQNPYLYSSPCYYAHELGQHMQRHLYGHVTDVRMGRGASIWANGFRFKAESIGAGQVFFVRQA